MLVAPSNLNLEAIPVFSFEITIRTDKVVFLSYIEK